jgi:hypothetical protein
VHDVRTVIKKYNENPNIDHFAAEKNRADAYEKQLAVCLRSVVILIVHPTRIHQPSPDSTLLSSSLLYSRSLFSNLFSSIVLCSPLLYFTPLHSTVLSYTLLYSNLVLSILLILLHSTLLFFTLYYYTPEIHPILLNRRRRVARRRMGSGPLKGRWELSHKLKHTPIHILSQTLNTHSHTHAGGWWLLRWNLQPQVSSCVKSGKSSSPLQSCQPGVLRRLRRSQAFVLIVDLYA